MSGPILITGASGGIGREFARLHACNCDHLILLGRTQAHLDALKAELERGNKDLKVDVLAKDLSKPGAADEVYEMTSKRGIKLGYLINNAGFGDFGEFTDAKWNKIEHMMYLNMITVSRLTQLYAKDMVKEGKGRIMNVASIGAFVPGPLMAVYYATKAYVLHFTEALQVETANMEVRLMSLLPGAVWTNFAHVAREVTKDKAQYKESMMSPKECVDIALRDFKRGKKVCVTGNWNRFTTFLARILPREVMRRIAQRNINH